VLMTRSYVPEAKVGSLIDQKLQGLGVDRVDTRTGGATRIEQPQALAFDYISDGRGTVRVMGLQENKGSGYAKGTFRYLYRSKGKNDWSSLSVYDMRDRTGFVPFAVDAEKDIVYGLEQVDGRQALVSIALNPGLEKKVVYAHPNVDVTSLVQVGRDRHVVGAGFSEDHGEVVYFDEQVKALVASLGKALGGKAVYIGDMSQDRQRVLVWAGSDTDPGQYYLFDRTAKKLSPVMPDRPELAGQTLAQMKSISYKASDGTVIPAYLTLPPGKDSAKGLPAIVMPHGGPESRDEWGFDWLSQFYAAQGFAVLQPNFRGSSGLGEAHLQAGYGEWGRKMQTDLSDGVRYLAAQGMIDPERVCIVGWSYGGYAAMAGVTLENGVYRCAVAGAGVSDLAAMLESEVRQQGSGAESRNPIIRYWNRFMGAEGSGDRRLNERSPARMAARADAPVLLIHGRRDTIVPFDQSVRMERALREAGKPVEMITLEGEDHNLSRAETRRQMLEATVAFLEEHNPPNAP